MDATKHGTNRGWLAGCRERCCRLARNNYLNNTRGTVIRFVPGDQAYKLLQDLLRYGHTYETLSRATGLSTSTLSRWGAKKFRSVSLANYQRLRRGFNSNPGDDAYVNACGALRRIQALNLRGFGCRKIAEMSGVSLAMVLQIRNGYYTRVNRTIHDAIRKVFLSLVFEQQPTGVNADQSRRHAKKKGFLPFGVWDDIDDPKCVAEVDTSDCIDGVEMYPEMADAVLRGRALAARGFLVSDIAERADVPKSTLYKILYGDRPGTKIHIIEKIQEACDILEPLPDPQGAVHNKTRTLAKQRGWTATMDASD